ncbi:NAD(P)/FAD-dependent oxidoreductase [Terasakiella sp. A23]|uniref:NAD(P)/FAD-dependent oxidoreductase n=1 Tax=Terasakiella sp. FCG-A23 TaxID=3080561 RepID=UPI0029555134|nr:NAD(P)/FAD-dependent oxidoreductase [Terasakiella sp. A23]MDV7341031.1 NAD(P)/FAD-dependent oxidoreductase [Terasakiella sp. A23]
MNTQFDVVIIGAGPSGSVAASLLANRGVKVLVLEKLEFPRFIIGESLLPQSMEFLENAGLLKDVIEHGFQFKNGAAFGWEERGSLIDFRQKSSEGWGTTYQVQRANFDKLLADAAGTKGADIRYNHEVLSVDLSGDLSVIRVKDDQGTEFDIQCKFLLDGSGYGRVLPRLLDLERPSSFPVRNALFTHMKDNLHSKDFDRNKILITIHPEQNDIWYWLIPFSDGTSSVGVVVRPEVLETYEGDNSQKLWTLLREAEKLGVLLDDAEETRPVGQLSGYSCDVTHLCSDKFALLGNAGEFLDPVFSSGVTIALKSANLVVDPLMRQLEGETVDWDKEYADPLKVGVSCFKAFVESWYEGPLQKIIFNSPQGENSIRDMITSILAGYAWDEKNPFVQEPRKYLKMVASQCP